MEKNIQAIVFKVNDMFMAVNILDIERIIDYKSTFAIPDAPSYIEGVIDYEGIVLPVINLKKRFNEKKQEFNYDNKIIVIDRNESKAGIIVDSIDEIINLEESTMGKNQELVRRAANNYVNAVVRVDDRLIALLDISKVYECVSIN